MKQFKGMEDLFKDWFTAVAKMRFCQEYQTIRGLLTISMLAKAVALYSNDNVARVLSYFYLMVSKPEVPTKRFTDKDAALQFLEKYK